MAKTMSFTVSVFKGRVTVSYRIGGKTHTANVGNDRSGFDQDGNIDKEWRSGLEMATRGCAAIAKRYGREAKFRETKDLAYLRTAEKVAVKLRLARQKELAEAVDLSAAEDTAASIVAAMHHALDTDGTVRDSVNEIRAAYAPDLVTLILAAEINRMPLEGRIYPGNRKWANGLEPAVQAALDAADQVDRCAFNRTNVAGDMHPTRFNDFVSAWRQAVPKEAI